MGRKNRDVNDDLLHQADAPRSAAWLRSARPLFIAACDDFLSCVHPRLGRSGRPLTALVRSKRDVGDDDLESVCLVETEGAPEPSPTPRAGTRNGRGPPAEEEPSPTPAPYRWVRGAPRAR